LQINYLESHVSRMFPNKAVGKRLGSAWEAKRFGPHYNHPQRLQGHRRHTPATGNEIRVGAEEKAKRLIRLAGRTSSTACAPGAGQAKATAT
jgi:hypothetical protein